MPMIIPCTVNCLTCFVSAQANQLQHAVPVQQRYRTTSLPRSKRLLVSWLQLLFAVILEPRKIKSDTVSPSISHEVMGPDAMIFVFWMLSFKSTFLLSSFTFIKRLFSSSFSAIRMEGGRQFSTIATTHTPLPQVLQVQIKVAVLISWSCCTNYHTLGGLKQQKCIISQFWRLGVEGQRYW